MRNLPLLVMLGLSCADPSATVEPEATSASAWAVTADEGELQGKYLLGEVADGLAVGAFHFSVSREASNDSVDISVEQAHLVATNRKTGARAFSGLDAKFIGLVFPVTTGGLLRIDGVVASDAGPSELATYRLSYLPATAAKWLDYCPGGEAIPLQGQWTTMGYHQLGTMVSFACHNGVARKCTRWGYVAGSSPLPPTSLWPHHQACTRMARADYCGDGTSHTREMTPIWIRDDVPGAEPAGPPLPMWNQWPEPPPPDRVFFEAGWGAGNFPKAGAICLSKTRWASKPLGGDCDLLLPDPRLHPGAKFCDDLPHDDLADAGALLWNGSKTMDLALRRWKPDGGGEQVSTVRGFLSGVGSQNQPPFPGYVYVGDEGFLLRNLPGSVDANDVKPMYLQRQSTTDRVLSDAINVPGHVYDADAGFEGYVFIDAGFAKTPLNLYVDDAGADYVSATTAPRGFGFVKTLGYVTAPP